MRNTRRLALMWAIPIGLVVLLMAAFMIGKSSGGGRTEVRIVRSGATAGPIQWRKGIPIGVEDTQAGALAAADNYLAVEEASLEGSPGQFAQLVAVDDAPEFRAADSQDAAGIRQDHPSSMRAWANGAHGVSVLAAHKLTSFSGATARVVVWAGGMAWGGGFTPQQHWALSTVSMRWASGQWWVTARSDDAASAPVPSAVPQATAQNTQPDWFNKELAGFTTVSVQ